MSNRKSFFMILYASLLVIASVCSLLLSRVLIGYADENSNVGFSVSPVYNEAQNKDSSFFDLLVAPNSQQTIGVTISNTSKEKSLFDIRLVQSSTNKNGVIDYTDAKGVNNPPFISLKEIATYDKHLDLDAGESKQIPITLSVPKAAFKGEVLGGVTITKNISKGKKNPQLVNQYSYVIGLRLREGDENPERNLLVGDAKPEVNFGKPGVVVPIINDRAVSMGHLEVYSKLVRDGKTIKEETYKEREIAPNSIYPYSLSWDQKNYLPGDYKLTIEVKDAQKHSWKFEKAFNLSPKEVNQVKNAAVHPPKRNMLWIWLVMGLFLTVIAGLIIYIVKNKHKDQVH